MKRKIIYIATLLLFATAINAQEEETAESTLTRDVNIVREYTPVIQDAGKISTLPKIEKAKVLDAGNIEYSTWSSALTPQFGELQTLPAASLKKMRQMRDLRQGYAKVGAGNYTSFLGDFYVPVLKNPTYNLDFSANHLSTFGKVKLDNDEKTKAKNMLNGGQLFFNKKFYPFNLYSELNFQRRDFNYYGLDSIRNNPTLYQDYKLKDEAHNFFDIGARVVSKEKDAGIYYDASFKYEMLSTKTELTENHFSTNGFLSTKWGDIDEVGVNISLDNFFYKFPNEAQGKLFNSPNVNDDIDPFNVFKFSPYYKFIRETWDVKLGLRIYTDKGFYASPDIVGKVAVVDKIFYVYGGVTGDYKINSRNNIFRENQYLRPDSYLENTYIPIDAYAGVKVKFFDYLIMNAYIGYTYIDNQYFYVNHRTDNPQYYDNSFNVVYDEANLFNVGGSLTYNDDKLSVLLKAKYNGWKLAHLDYAYHRPDWELDFDVSYKINDDIKVSMNAFAMGKRYAQGFNGNIKLDPVFDLSFSGVYEYTSWLSFFVNLNNVLAQNYQLWYGYNSHRFNAMGGAILSF